jgi:RNA polymerase primary sigma factor
MHPLSAEDEIALAVRLKQGGDQQARDALVLANEGLVYDLTRRWEQTSLHEDLVQEGMLGLFDAVDHFDPEGHPGVRFSTYAAYWINKRVRSYMLRSWLVRVPGYVLEKSNYVKGLRRPESVAGHEANRAKGRQAAQAHALLATKGGDMTRTPEPASGSSSALELMQAAEELVRLEAAIAMLPLIEQEVLRRLYGLGRFRRQGLKTVMQDLGFSEKVVKQLAASAMAQLRSLLQDDDAPRASKPHT